MFLEGCTVCFQGWQRPGCCSWKAKGHHWDAGSCAGGRAVFSCCWFSPSSRASQRSGRGRFLLGESSRHQECVSVPTQGSTHQLPAELPTASLPLLPWVCWAVVWRRIRCAPTLSLPNRRGFGQGCVEQQPCSAVKQDWRNLIFLKKAQISPTLAGGVHASAHLSVAQDCCVMFTCAMKWFTAAQSWYQVLAKPEAKGCFGSCVHLPLPSQWAGGGALALPSRCQSVVEGFRRLFNLLLLKPLQKTFFTGFVGSAELEVQQMLVWKCGIYEISKKEWGDAGSICSLY